MIGIELFKSAIGLPKPRFALAAALLALAGGPCSAVAAEFAYTGNQFDTFAGDATCPSQCSLSIAFGVSAPLDSYFRAGFPPRVAVINNPDWFTITDGRITVTNLDIGTGNGIGVDFEFYIDQDGDPDFSAGWIAQAFFNLSTIGGIQPLNTISSIGQGTGGIGTFGTMDQSFHFADGSPGTFDLPGSGIALVADSPGQWSFTPTATPIPEPTTWAMLLIGLGALGGQIRRHARIRRYA